MQSGEMNVRALVALLLTAGAALSTGAEAPPSQPPPAPPVQPGLDHYRRIYDAESARIEATREDARKEALAAYGRSLNAARERSRQSGVLEGLVAVSAEIERFAREKGIPDPDPADLHSGLAALRTTYRQAVASAVSTHAQAQVALASKYLTPLETLKKQFVTRDKVEEALKIDTEIKRVQFIMADFQSRLPPPAVAPDPVPPTNAVETTPPVVASGPPGNVVRNGGFETKLTGWEVSDWSGKTKELKTTTRFAKSGRYALVHEPRTSLQQYLTLVPGRTYRASFWVRVLKPPPDGMVGGIYFDSARTGDMVVNKPADWQEHSIQFKATRPDHTLTVYCSREAGECYYDDVCVIPVAGAGKP
jgi:hypothetical protein